MSATSPQIQRLLEPDRSGLRRQARPWLLKTCFTCLHQLHLPQSSEAATWALCVRESNAFDRATVAMLPTSRAGHPRASVTQAHGTPNETARQAHASTTLTLPLPRHQACFSLRHRSTVCIIKDTFPKRLLAHYSATTVTCLDTQNVHFSSKECAHSGSSLKLGILSKGWNGHML